MEYEKILYRGLRMLSVGKSSQLKHMEVAISSISTIFSTVLYVYTCTKQLHSVSSRLTVLPNSLRTMLPSSIKAACFLVEKLRFSAPACIDIVLVQECVCEKSVPRVYRS